MHKIPVVSVVDDDESVRVSVSSLMRSLGYSAPAFASAEDFLSAAELHLSDCVITDIQMPGMTGMELQQELIQRGNAVPIIFITAFPEDRVRERVISAGATCLLSKPCDSDELVSCVETALARSPSR